MNEDLELVTGPVAVCTVDELKAQMRVDFSDEDDLIAELGGAAQELCERFTYRAFLTQTWKLHLDHFPGSRPHRELLFTDPHVGLARFSRLDWAHHQAIYLPKPPLQSVTSVTYYDASGAGPLTLDPSLYQVATWGVRGRIAPAVNQSWPDTQQERLGGIVITFVAGYGDTPDKVPYRIKQAIRVEAANLYQGRESYVVGTSVSENPSTAVARILRPFQAKEF